MGESRSNTLSTPVSGRSQSFVKTGILDISRSVRQVKVCRICTIRWLFIGPEMAYISESLYWSLLWHVVDASLHWGVLNDEKHSKKPHGLVFSGRFWPALARLVIDQSF
jgi:hypothetical protein